MITTTPDLVESLYERWRAAFAAEPEMPLDRWRAMIEDWPQVTAEPGGVDYLEVEAGSVPAMWITPKDAAEDRVILSIHGGGFVVGSMYTHRKLFGHIAKAAGARALSPDYRRPPEHLHRGLPMPAAAMPFSAWFDLTGSGELQRTNAETDKLLNKKFGNQLADILLGESGDRRDPYVSALYADLAGLPPLYLQVSDAETLLDDSRALAERAWDAGVDVRLDIFAGQQHTFQMAAGRSPVADDAIGRLAGWVRPHLGL
jgi:monoterpene epsilon-lactone hydrolase